jgi:hypothetical protein
MTPNNNDQWIDERHTTVTFTGTLKKIEFTHFITISPQYKKPQAHGA